MRKVFVITLTFLFCLLSCEVEAPDTNDDDIVHITSKLVQNSGSSLYPDNEIIVQYNDNTTEAQKQVIRNFHGVIDYKNCSCAEPTLELWIFDAKGINSNGGTIEEKLITVKDDEGLDDAEFNPVIQHKGYNLQSSFGPSEINNGIAKVTADNNRVTIAVLDTGIDYNYFRFNQPFLYNSVLGENGCDDNGYTDYFGWDFVNQDNDPYDDYGHGTIISSMIADRLQNNNIDFQILPVKVFDENGKGNYFDILCGFRYAATNKDVEIINMSFGWSNSSYEILEHFVNASQKEVLLSTSAGNSGANNDSLPHYPSSYQAENILASASLSATSITEIQLAWFSNRGTQSVDIAAPGSGLLFFLTPTGFISLNGTSYSNAIVSAYAASNYQDGMTIKQLKKTVIQNSIYNANLNEIQYSSYINYLPD